MVLSMHNKSAVGKFNCVSDGAEFGGGPSPPPHAKTEIITVKIMLVLSIVFMVISYLMILKTTGFSMSILTK